MAKITKKEIRDMVEGIYYSNADVLWEPFEYYEKEQVEEFIDTDVRYWADFLKNKGIEII
jgi:hypothetical protein